MGGAVSRNAGTALRLARMGFHVFPCRPGGDRVKQPMPFMRWRDVSTSDERTVSRWWAEWPDAAIGLDLGKSGMLVIDADRHGPHDGVEAFGELMAANGYQPDDVPLAATPNEGTHFFYRQPPGMNLGNGRGGLPDGVDVRGKGGYVIAPGTVMQDGRMYEVFGDISEAPELPPWLIKIIEGGEPRPAPVQRTEHSDARIEAYCDQAIREELRRAATAPKGTRNNTLNEAAFALGQLVGAGWVARSEIEGLLLQAAHDCGLKHGEAVKTIRSGLNAGEKDPRTLPDDGFDHQEAAEAARVLAENLDGTLYDTATGELVDEPEPEDEAEGEVVWPSGVTGDLARWIVATSRHPQPELAIGAALTIVGTAAGRQFCGPTQSGTHLYILGLAGTGAGKDHGLHQIMRVMQAAGMGTHLGPSEFISMPSVVNFLCRKPLSVCPMDEFGGFMRRINSRKASGFEFSISKSLRTLWSCSFSTYVTPEWAAKESQIVLSPAISLYGASTPEQFYSSMEGANMEDGTLNRFLLIGGRKRVGAREPKAERGEVPDSIVKDLHLIYYRSGDMASTWRNDANVDPMTNGTLRDVGWCPDGSQERYQAFSEEMMGMVEADPEYGSLYVRTAEMALRIATIIAIGRLEDDQVRLSDLEYGIKLAKRSADMMVRGAVLHMADNENQANFQKILRVIRSHGGRIQHKKLLVSLKGRIRARELKELIGMMCEAEIIERYEKPGGSGPPATWYRLC